MANPIPAELIATVDDFICVYPTCESVELSNLDSAMATEPNRDKIQFALDQALQLVCSYEILSCPSAQIAIRKRTKRNMLIIARHELDVLHRRDDVAREYERVITWLDAMTDPKYCDIVPCSQDLIDVGLVPPCGGNYGKMTFDGLPYDLNRQRRQLNKNYLRGTINGF